MLFLFVTIKAQDTELEEIKNNIITQFSKIDDYQVDINIKINMTGFRMPKKKIKMFFKKPDKLNIKTNGFAIIPKTGINNNPNELFEMFNYITEVNRTIRNNKQFYFITGIVNPDSIDVPIKNFQSENANITMSLLIDAKEWIITEVDIILDKEKIFSIKTDYINIDNIMVPEKTNLSIGIKEISRIKNNFNNDLLFNSDNDFIKASGLNLKNDEFKGEISLEFSNYIINQGIDDNVFIRN
jgi:outer membrane lipoprotein-sorting protein